MQLTFETPSTTEIIHTILQPIARNVLPAEFLFIISIFSLIVFNSLMRKDPNTDQTTYLSTVFLPKLLGSFVFILLAIVSITFAKDQLPDQLHCTAVDKIIDTIDNEYDRYLITIHIDEWPSENAPIIIEVSEESFNEMHIGAKWTCEVETSLLELIAIVFEDMTGIQHRRPHTEIPNILPNSHEI